jgi:two-component system sensor histidine kinase/response regulator
MKGGGDGDGLAEKPLRRLQFVSMAADARKEYRPRFPTRKGRGGVAMPSRILLVDDEPKNLVLLEAHLGFLGHELIRATDGRSALAAFGQRRPDLVLLDYNMPDLDGVEVLTRIRARPDGAHIPVVLITAHSDREHRLLGMSAGADEFLEKPIDSAILVARGRTMLELKRSRDQLQASRDELEQRHDALKEAQREQRELTEFIIHDLKNPLSVVCAGLDWARGQISPSQVELAETIVDVYAAAGRLNAMIGDLLVISRMEQPDFPLQREPVSVPRLLDSVVHSYARRADEKKIRLEFPASVSLDVQADRPLLQRVLENILDNAFRYTPPEGRISVQARPWNGVEITVCNDGVPIPLRERRSIFEKFRRGCNEKFVPGNAGLGLYFCKRAIEAHGGAIDVVDTKDWATSFLINLP